MPRFLTTLRKGLLHCRRHGLAPTLGKTMLRWGYQLYTPPQPLPSYPQEIIHAMDVDFSLQECIQEARELNKRWTNDPHPPRRILWVMPDYRNVHNGGPNTIIRFANHFARKGIQNTLYIFNGHIHQTPDQIKREITSVFGENDNLNVILNPYTKPISYQDLPDSDIAISTLWHTAYLLLPYTKTKAKFYFIQDYEKLFYSAGIEYKLADISYDFGYFGIFNTPGLERAVTNDHEMTGRSFVPGIDSQVFYPTDRPLDQGFKKLFFYGRPEVPRNGFPLGIAGLAQVAERFPETGIYIAGHHTTYPELNINARFLDYLDYRETGEFYRSCGGLVSFMFTPHPSYIPLQAMSCGTIPIALRDPSTAWALKHEQNCLLINPLPVEILEAYIRLRYDRELREHLRQNAIRSFSHVRWQDEMEKVFRWMIEGCTDSEVDFKPQPYSNVA